MELYSICYVSTVSPKVREEDVLHLFEEVIKKNQIIEITGLLLHSEGNFMQVMEGKKKKVNALFERIKEDPRHHHIIEILSTPIKHRVYANYNSGFTIINTEKKDGAVFKLRLFINWLEENFDGIIKKQAEIIQPFIKYI